MSYTEIAYKLEEMELRARIICSMTMAVHDAMEGNGGTSELYCDALYGVTEFTRDFHKDLKKLMDGAFETLRAQKEVA